MFVAPFYGPFLRPANEPAQNHAKVEQNERSGIGAAFVGDILRASVSGWQGTVEEHGDYGSRGGEEQAPRGTAGERRRAREKAREAHPEARPRVISDRGVRFVCRDFQTFIRLWQTSRVLTSPHYPQRIGKLERFHRTLKEQAIRPKTSLILEDAKRIVGEVHRSL
jgi:hypothetical protein